MILADPRRHPFCSSATGQSMPICSIQESILSVIIIIIIYNYFIIVVIIIFSIVIIITIIIIITLLLNSIIET